MLRLDVHRPQYRILRSKSNEEAAIAVKQQAQLACMSHNTYLWGYMICMAHGKICQ